LTWMRSGPIVVNKKSGDTPSNNKYSTTRRPVMIASQAYCALGMSINYRRSNPSLNRRLRALLVTEIKP